MPKKSLGRYMVRSERRDGARKISLTAQRQLVKCPRVDASERYLCERLRYHLKIENVPMVNS